MGVFTEIDQGRYAATPISKALTAPSLRNLIKHLLALYPRYCEI
jgi:hypothetical protein